MKHEMTPEELEYTSMKQPDEEKHYTPRPKFHIIMAWVLLAVVIFAILGMCYWEMFGIF